MRHFLTILSTFALTFFYSQAFAQSSTGGGGTDRYAQAGLTFVYPAGWTITDKSTPQAQHLIVARPGNSALIMVIAHRDLITSPQELRIARSGITDPFVEDVAQKFAAGGSAPARDFPCAAVGTHVVNGIRMRGPLNNKQRTAEVYPLVLGQRFVNLVYIRADKDEAQSVGAWETVRNSVSVESPPQAGGKSTKQLEMLPDGGLLNGMAMRLPPPKYPMGARKMRAEGPVVVEVTIDEVGNVTTAHVASGHPALRDAAVEAARGAKFAPTVICGESHRVTGVITYNFVPF